MPKIRVTVGRIIPGQLQQKYFRQLLSLLYEILLKISYSLFYLAEGLSQQTDKSESQNNEVEQPFEPQIQFWLSNLIILRGC